MNSVNGSNSFQDIQKFNQAASPLLQARGRLQGQLSKTNKLNGHNFTTIEQGIGTRFSRLMNSAQKQLYNDVKDDLKLMKAEGKKLNAQFIKLNIGDSIASLKNAIGQTAKSQNPNWEGLQERYATINTALVAMDKLSGTLDPNLRAALTECKQSIQTASSRPPLPPEPAGGPVLAPGEPGPNLPPEPEGPSRAPEEPAEDANPTQSEIFESPYANLDETLAAVRGKVREYSFMPANADEAEALANNKPPVIPEEPTGGPDLPPIPPAETIEIPKHLLPKDGPDFLLGLPNFMHDNSDKAILKALNALKPGELLFCLNRENKPILFFKPEAGPRVGPIEIDAAALNRANINAFIESKTQQTAKTPDVSARDRLIAAQMANAASTAENEGIARFKSEPLFAEGAQLRPQIEQLYKGNVPYVLGMSGIPQKPVIYFLDGGRVIRDYSVSDKLSNPKELRAILQEKSHRQQETMAHTKFLSARKSFHPDVKTHAEAKALLRAYGDAGDALIMRDEKGFWLFAHKNGKTYKALMSVKVNEKTMPAFVRQFRERCQITDELKSIPYKPLDNI